MVMVPRHKVFVSFHHEDQWWKDAFSALMEHNIIDKSVSDGDIDDENLQTETIRRKIREEFIADATVTVVLIGQCTWQRKHVDWEIGASLRDTPLNPRCGLLGIILPDHPDFNSARPRPALLPPRLADNFRGTHPFASLQHWAYAPDAVRCWVDGAFQRRHSQPPPDNSRTQFRRNRGGNCWDGWS